MASNPDRQRLHEIIERLKFLKEEQARRREETESLKAERNELRERLGMKTRAANEAE